MVVSNVWYGDTFAAQIIILSMTYTISGKTAHILVGQIVDTVAWFVILFCHKWALSNTTQLFFGMATRWVFLLRFEQRRTIIAMFKQQSQDPRPDEKLDQKSLIFTYSYMRIMLNIACKKGWNIGDQTGYGDMVGFTVTICNPSPSQSIRPWGKHTLRKHKPRTSLHWGSFINTPAGNLKRKSP